MEEKYTLNMQCLFCKSEKFELPEEDYQPSSGEMLKCGNCGRLNDYDSLMRVANLKATELVEKEVKKEIDKFSKQLEKMFK